MAIFTPVILKGDYTGSGSTSHERQNRATNEGCVCVVDFHFNSFTDASASGGEVHYQQGVQASKQFAEVMWAQIAATGLPAHGNSPVKSTADATRSAFIEHYSMPTVLIEPLFISNATQAAWLHGPAGNQNLNKLADAITAAIKGQFLGGGKIGLSPGHAHKTTSPNDKGSQCNMGDWEVDHVLALVALVEQKLA